MCNCVSATVEGIRSAEGLEERLNATLPRDFRILSCIEVNVLLIFVFFWELFVGVQLVPHDVDIESGKQCVDQFSGHHDGDYQAYL